MPGVRRSFRERRDLQQFVNRRQLTVKVALGRGFHVDDYPMRADLRTRYRLGIMSGGQECPAHTLRLQRVHVGEQILDLLLVKGLSKAGHLAAAQLDDFAHALVVGGQATL